MKRSILQCIIILIISAGVKAQDIYWKAGLYSFFDNVEFGRSAVKIPQTMAGVQFMPQFGLRRDSVHRLTFGLNLIHEFGSGNAVDKLYPTAWYEYNKRPFRFLMGAFPRSETLYRYPRIFFQDSINYYRPNINGIFCEVSRGRDYLNLWLDWTGRQSITVNEAFFVGFDGRIFFGPFYLRHTDFMFHFAGKMEPSVPEALHDNLLFLTSAGIDLSGRTFLTTLDVNAGWIEGLERARSDNTGWIPLPGFLSEARIEYKFAGIFNTFYIGSGLFYFYRSHGSRLYWGDPAYRTGTYNRSDFYLKLLNSSLVKLELMFSLHFLESRVYNEQMLRLKVDLNRK